MFVTLLRFGQNPAIPRPAGVTDDILLCYALCYKPFETLWIHSPHNFKKRTALTYRIMGTR